MELKKNEKKTIGEDGRETRGRDKGTVDDRIPSMELPKGGDSFKQTKTNINDKCGRNEGRRM